MATRQGGGYSGISNYLTQTLLPRLTTLRLSNIYAYEPTDLGGYPSCTVTAQAMDGKIIDNTRNERIHIFTIRLFIDRNVQNLGVVNAESILRTVADEIVLQIDSDPSLGGNCIDADPFNAKMGYINRQNQNIRVMEITLLCRDAVTWR